MAVGALEPQFYAELLDVLGLDPADWPQHDRRRWAEQGDALARIFAGRTRAEWSQLFDGRDACVTPVLSLTEAPSHPHAIARDAFVDVDGLVQPAPAPRFSRTANAVPVPPRRTGADTGAVLTELGLTGDEVDELEGGGVIGT
jgi:alpha-methylacyl-CoA racemase